MIIVIYTNDNSNMLYGNTDNNIVYHGAPAMVAFCTYGHGPRRLRAQKHQLVIRALRV